MNFSYRHFILFSTIMPVLIIVVTLMSISMGTKSIALETIIDAIIRYDKENVDHQIIWTGRVPRALAVLFVGAFLATAGAIMQGVTRNFLASPSIMGVTDGSAFFITLAFVFLPGISSFNLVLLSMLGSLFGGALVFGFASIIKNGLSPVRLAIIGTVIGTFISSIGTAIAMYRQISQTITMWYNSKVHMVEMELIYLCVPIGMIGLILAISLARAVTITALGEDVAVGLGQNTRIVKLLSMLAVAILTGTAVALVGKIAFVGLIVPHIVRMLVGVDYRVIIPCSAVMGAFFLSGCDLISRYINFPFETPIGVVTALIGVPFFLYLIRRKGGEKYAA
ncbi:ABC-type Fe3+-siderophore transport system, permease component [Solibacillus silvestris StLB046]|uniref:ABC-type Fe3+-siderophore transport system, permease component n=1 Tax=Solibacillus silvestris (strain StLB046) TaxID=1002809 RepID=F2F4S3_SOLSS|nr:iron ABC transporter permease [Solibacillus silvestris]BAK16488.1 ABC-type Fe3+-siderophore transport system, permease component [Solibacillus silvestris StLB046]